MRKLRPVITLVKFRDWLLWPHKRCLKSARVSWRYEVFARKSE